jgi:hypothetical protein
VKSTGAAGDGAATAGAAGGTGAGAAQPEPSTSVKGRIILEKERCIVRSFADSRARRQHRRPRLRSGILPESA